MRDRTSHEDLSAEPTAFSQACDDVLDYLAGRVPRSTWSVSRIDDYGQVHMYVRGERFVATGDVFSVEQTLCARMLDGGPRVVADASTEPTYRDLAAPLGIHGYAAAPISVGARESIGSLCGFSEVDLAPGLVDEGLLNLLTRTISRAFVLTRRVRALDLELRIARDTALTDPLTGVLNRRGWETVVAEASRRADSLGDRFDLFVLDVDGLKRTNDDAGHAAGDALLRRTATALASTTRHRDSVARTGGDEFAVLVEVTHPTDEDAVLQRLRRALDRVDVHASIGHSRLERNDRGDHAMARADRAMYAEKRERASALDGDGPDPQAGTPNTDTRSS